MPPQSNNNTRLFVLNNEDLVIADVPLFQGSGNMVLETPAHIMVTRNHIQEGLGFVLFPWQPFELLASPTVVLAVEKNVMCELVPSAALVEYYKCWKRNETDKLARFDSQITEQLQQIIKLTNTRHHAMVTADSYAEFTSVVVDKFEHDESWGDPSITN